MNSLLEFLRQFPPPATAAELFGEINSLRVYGNVALPDLPQTPQELQDGLDALAGFGLVEATAGDTGDVWRVRKAAQPEAQRSLFA